MVFLARIALMEYRLGLPGFELPAPIAEAQARFDTSLASRLNGMAARLAGKVSKNADTDTDTDTDADGDADGDANEGAFARLEDACDRYQAAHPDDALTTRLDAFLPLSRHIDRLTLALNAEVS